MTEGAATSYGVPVFSLDSMMKRIDLIAGARPNFMKIAPSSTP